MRHRIKKCHFCMCRNAVCSHCVESPLEFGRILPLILNAAQRGSVRPLSTVLCAQDSLAFLRGLMQRFPRFQSREFYIAGESYGGHYVPELAAAILRHNEDLVHRNKEHSIALKVRCPGNAKTILQTASDRRARAYAPPTRLQ